MAALRAQIRAVRTPMGWRLHCPGLGVCANVVGSWANLCQFAHPWVAVELGRDLDTVEVDLVYADGPGNGADHGPQWRPRLPPYT